MCEGGRTCEAREPRGTECAVGGGQGNPRTEVLPAVARGCPLRSCPCPGTHTDGGAEVWQKSRDGARGSLHSSSALGLGPLSRGCFRYVTREPNLPRRAVPVPLPCPGDIWSSSHHPPSEEPARSAGYPGSSRMTRTGQRGPHSPCALGLAVVVTDLGG